MLLKNLRNAQENNCTKKRSWRFFPWIFQTFSEQLFIKHHRATMTKSFLLSRHFQCSQIFKYCFKIINNSRKRASAWECLSYYHVECRFNFNKNHGPFIGDILNFQNFSCAESACVFLNFSFILDSLGSN